MSNDDDDKMVKDGLQGLLVKKSLTVGRLYVSSTSQW